ncbi:25040_t:CDS:2 [Gigaspora rosea]|nr:25040_t:CDS:2 [Gigaspora rosea]
MTNKQTYIKKNQIEARFKELEKTLQPLLDKLDTDEEIEIKGRRVSFKSWGQVLEKTVEKSDKRNKAQQICENMPLYFQDLDQGSNVKPIMPIETTGDLMSERCWSREAREKLCQRLTSSKGGTNVGDIFLGSIVGCARRLRDEEIQELLGSWELIL